MEHKHTEYAAPGLPVLLGEDISEEMWAVVAATEPLLLAAARWKPQPNSSWEQEARVLLSYLRGHSLEQLIHYLQEIAVNRDFGRSNELLGLRAELRDIFVP